MSAYYPTAASHISHRHETPVVYSSSHRSHGTPYVAGSHAYSQNPSNYGAENVIYVPSSSHGHGHSRGHGHRSHHYGTVAPTTVISAGDGHRHHRRSRHRSHGHETHHSSLGERIRRFFGLAPKHHPYKHKSRTSSWGFLGRSRRRRYMDARTGAEIDRHGRPVYRV